MQLDFTRVIPSETGRVEFPHMSNGYTRYQVPALTAAEEELIRQRREAIRQAATKENIQDAQQLAEEKAGTPLNLEWKVLTFLFPGMLQLIFSTAFKAEGYDRKAKDLTRWTLLGFGFYAALLVAAFAL